MSLDQNLDSDSDSSSSEDNCLILSKDEIKRKKDLWMKVGNL